MHVNAAEQERITLVKTTIYGFLGLNLLVVLSIFFVTSFDLLLSGFGGLFIALGRLFGLLAAFAVLLQFLLMSRSHWLESQFGLDNIARFHRIVGFIAILFIVLHPTALVIGYSADSMISYFDQYALFLGTYNGVKMAAIAQILFILVVFSSIFIVRKHLKFESWYWVHLLVYAAIALAFTHQLSVGGSFIDNPLYAYYWYGLYAFVGLNVLLWRFSMPIYNFIRYRFNVSAVKSETKDTHSIYISGNNLHRWTSKPGQYVLVRFLVKGLWWQEHPFSLSYIPKNNSIRLTIKAVGDYTTLVQSVLPGTKVIVSGPYGVFTERLAKKNKRLYVAGGVGITPLRSLIEQSVNNSYDSVLIYGTRTQADVIFANELAQFTTSNVFSQYLVLSDDSDSNAEKGYVTADRIARLVPDYKERDIYLCGPPVMMDSVIKGLTELKFPIKQLHYEKFSFHTK